ncbi:MAG TPA: hypothetical protein ENK02_14170 [Planctomycetes bacterium]|nr:hypothetical protein [Planctomycetota bacterium]
MRHSTMISSLLLLGLGAPGGAFAQERLPVRDPAGPPVQDLLRRENPAESKIQGELLADARRLEERGFVKVGGIAKPFLRVVIDIRREKGDPTFENSKARDRVAEVARGVLKRQKAFEQKLGQQSPLGAKKQVVLIGRLSLQYSVVARVFSRSALLALGARPDVKYVWKDRLNKLMTVEGRALTGSTTAASNGYKGTGIGVAVIDTKFDLLHPELGGSTTLPNGVVYAGKNFSNTNQSIHSRTFNDAYHGTGTSAIVRRYAPNVHLYCLTVFPNAYNSVIANAINWCVTNKNGKNGGNPIKIISMSLGGGKYTSPETSGTIHSACGTALSNGIVTFVAAGNDGYNNAMGSPAASTNTISVGSVWDANNAPYSPFPPAYCSDNNRVVNERACYSDTASFLDIYMPSEQVITAKVGGGTFALGGTSSACPAAAGITAQFFQAFPAYQGNMSQLANLYKSTGVQVVGDSTHKRVNIIAAMNAANGGGGGGGGGGGSTVLKNGVTQNYSVSTGANKTWTISLPSNVTSMTVTLTGSGDADLYVKNAPVNWPGDKGSHNTSTFKAPYIGGSSESVTFTNPAAGTWHVLVNGYSGNPSGTIKASWVVGSGGGGAKWNYVTYAKETPHNYSNNKTYTYTYSSPGATRVAVHFNRLDTESGYDFVRIKDKFGNTKFKVSGNLISGGSGSAFGRTDGWVIVDGDSLTVELKTDYSVTRYGLKLDRAANYK